MDAVSDDLMKPLGMDRREKAPRPPLPVLRLLGIVLVAASAALSLYVGVANDPLGGEPHALVPIEAGEGARAGTARKSSAQAPEPSTESRGRASAGEVEAQSGVSVIRPEGAAPTSVIIQVPDNLRSQTAGPDSRLIERSRYGPLPKIGPDGSRPSKVYARPPDALGLGGAAIPRVAVVVGGLGISSTVTNDAIVKLPSSVTLAFAPYGNDLDRHVAQARADGHEIMLQAPMEPFDYPDNDPGPNTLTTRGGAQDNIANLHWAMGRFTGYVGVINFMGAKLTANEAALTPILREIGSRGLFFVDDGSSSRSLVSQAGLAPGAPTARADMVLDGVPRPDAVDRQLERLEQLARQRGFALGSASALPVTLDRIAAWARALETRGVLLVPISSAFERGNDREG